MNDIEFNCPNCSTALVVSAVGSGTTISCPKCAHRIEVPGPIRVVVVGTPPPLVPSQEQDHRNYDLGITIRTRNCTMAYVALALVCASFVTGFFLLLPGMVCGHIALEQCKNDPHMTGRAYAVAALSIGYTVAALAVLAIIGIVLLWGMASLSS